MRTILLNFFIFLSFAVFSQPVEMQIFVTGTGVTNGKVGVRIHSTIGTIQYTGVSFYILYQSANATPGIVDDSKLVTTYEWGTSARQINTGQVVNITLGSKTYNRRYIYLNADETTGSSTITLTSNWDTLLYIPFNYLQSTYPQGGNVYAQETAEAGNVALTDPGFNNIDVDVTSGGVPFGPNITLPVVLTSFDAQCIKNATVLRWTTATEKNNSYFEVEKRITSTDWSVIRRVLSSGNNATENRYQMNDVQGGSAQYRLKQVDKDETVVYSRILTITCEDQKAFVSLYPVPASDVIKLTISTGKNVKTILQVFDETGKLLINVPVNLRNGINNIQINVRSLANGEYFIRSSDVSIQINKHFTVIR